MIGTGGIKLEVIDDENIKAIFITNDADLGDPAGFTTRQEVDAFLYKLAEARDRIFGRDFSRLELGRMYRTAVVDQLEIRPTPIPRLTPGDVALIQHHRREQIEEQWENPPELNATEILRRREEAIRVREQHRRNAINRVYEQRVEEQITAYILPPTTTPRPTRNTNRGPQRSTNARREY
jgi:hypothetical protein